MKICCEIREPPTRNAVGFQLNEGRLKTKIGEDGNCRYSSYKGPGLVGDHGTGPAPIKTRFKREF